MIDPTLDEMTKHLEPWMNRYGADEYDLQEAIYWYAHDYHGGQTTNLYSVLSTSPFRPGAYSTGLTDGAPVDLYGELCEHFGMPVR